MKVKLISFVLISLFFTGCEGMSVQGSYQPPIIPLKVSVDTNRKISFEVEKEIDFPTSLGTFSVGVVLNPDEYFHKGNTLTVRLDCEDYFYDLSDKDFSIEFSSGYYEKIDLTKRGDNILLELRRRDGNTSGELADCPTPIGEPSNPGSDNITATESQFLKSITANNFQELSGFQVSGDCTSGFLSKDDCNNIWGLEFTLTNNSNTVWYVSPKGVNSCANASQTEDFNGGYLSPQTQLTVICSNWPGGIASFDPKAVTIYATPGSESSDSNNNLCIYVYSNQAKRAWTNLDC